MPGWRVKKKSTQKIIRCPHCNEEIDVTEPIRAHFCRLGRLGGHIHHGTPINDDPRYKMDIISDIKCPHCKERITTKKILRTYFHPLGKIGGTISRRTLTSKKASQMGKLSGQSRRRKIKERHEKQANICQETD